MLQLRKQGLVDQSRVSAANIALANARAELLKKELELKSGSYVEVKDPTGLTGFVKMGDVFKQREMWRRLQERIRAKSPAGERMVSVKGPDGKTVQVPEDKAWRAVLEFAKLGQTGERLSQGWDRLRQRDKGLGLREREVKVREELAGIKRKSLPDKVVVEVDGKKLRVSAETVYKQLMQRLKSAPSKELIDVPGFGKMTPYQAASLSFRLYNAAKGGGERTIRWKSPDGRIINVSPDKAASLLQAAWKFRKKQQRDDESKVEITLNGKKLRVSVKDYLAVQKQLGEKTSYTLTVPDPVTGDARKITFTDPEKYASALLRLRKQISAEQAGDVKKSELAGTVRTALAKGIINRLNNISYDANRGVLSFGGHTINIGLETDTRSLVALGDNLYNTLVSGAELLSNPEIAASPWIADTIRIKLLTGLQGLVSIYERLKTEKLADEMVFKDSIEKAKDLYDAIVKNPAAALPSVDAGTLLSTSLFDTGRTRKQAEPAPSEKTKTEDGNVGEAIKAVGSPEKQLADAARRELGKLDDGTKNLIFDTAKELDDPFVVVDKLASNPEVVDSVVKSSGMSMEEIANKYGSVDGFVRRYLGALVSVVMGGSDEDIAERIRMLYHEGR